MLCREIGAVCCDNNVKQHKIGADCCDNNVKQHTIGADCCDNNVKQHTISFCAKKVEFLDVKSHGI